MLVSLLVKNFAIIDNAQINFSNGMTVITGETGAGKSLIIDAISLLLGKRAQNDLIRYGENKASITGVFSNYSEEIISYLDDFGISYDVNDNLIIKRELYANGKSICKINNEIITLNELSKIGDLIGDIHSQIDTFGLINPKNYLSFIRSKEIDKLVEEYKIKLDEYKKLESSYNNKIKENDEIKLKADFIKYQYNELKQASLNETEEKELKDEENYLLNYNKLLENINGFKEIYDDKGIDYSHFVVFVGNQEEQRPKPDPYPILKALEMMNYKGNFMDITYVGDSVNDCIAASRAGIDSFLLDRNNEFKGTPYKIIHSLMDLFKD